MEEGCQWICKRETKTRQILLPERIEVIGPHNLEVTGYLKINFDNPKMLCVFEKRLGSFICFEFHEYLVKVMGIENYVL